MHEDLDPESVSGSSSEATERATGKSWQAWMALLDSAGGRGMSHKQIVAHLNEHYDISPWWQQQVTVVYENSRRLRNKHEVAGGYQISRSRTMAVGSERIYECWLDEAERRKWLADAEFTVRKATPHKSIRITWHDGTNVEVNLSAKGQDKSTVMVQHNKLPDENSAERMKEYWSAALANLEKALGV